MIWYLNGTFPMKQPRGVINPGLTLQALWSFSWGAVVPVYSQSSDSLYACQVFLGHWVCWKNHHVISCLYRGLQTGKEKETSIFWREMVKMCWNWVRHDMTLHQIGSASHVFHPWQSDDTDGSVSAKWSRCSVPHLPQAWAEWRRAFVH